jgi:hypothetical protein
MIKQGHIWIKDKKVFNILFSCKIGPKVMHYVASNASQWECQWEGHAHMCNIQ